jgi:hypothetical protein
MKPSHVRRRGEGARSFARLPDAATEAAIAAVQTCAHMGNGAITMPALWGTRRRIDMKLKMILAAGMLAALASPAIAQPGGAPLTPEQREARFKLGDKNGDSKLDKAEWTAILPEQAQAMADQLWSSRVDADGDGFITKEQFLALRMGPRPGGR